MAAAAGVGAVVAALHDSGFKDDDLTSVADLMADGRTVLILDVGPDYVDKMRSALTTSRSSSPRTGRSSRPSTATPGTSCGRGRGLQAKSIAGA